MKPNKSLILALVIFLMMEISYGHFYQKSKHWSRRRNLGAGRETVD